MRFVVTGSSMSPTYNEGDRLWVSRLYYILVQPRTGDIVVVKDPRNGRLLLKRIKKISKKGYFIAGDNPSKSTDSRTFGEVERNKIVGKVLFRYSSNS